MSSLPPNVTESSLSPRELLHDEHVAATREDKDEHGEAKSIATDSASEVPAPAEKMICILEDWATWEKNLEVAAARDEVARRIKETADNTCFEPSNVVDSSCPEFTGSDNVANHFDKPYGLPYMLTHATERAAQHVKHEKALDTIHNSSSLTCTRDQRERRSTQDEAPPPLDAPRLCQSIPVMHGALIFAENRNTASSPAPLRTKLLHREEPQGCCGGRSSNQKERSLSVEEPMKHRDKRQRDHFHLRQANERTQPNASSKCSARVKVEQAHSGRPSPWVKSPSRETAKGVLVKQNFFFGSARCTGDLGCVSDATDPTTGCVRHLPHVESTVSMQRVRKCCKACQTLALCKRHRNNRQLCTRSDTCFNQLVSRRKDETKGVPNCWSETGNGIACGGRRDNLSNDRGGDEPRYSSDMNISSFHDRLRLTPLSQGTWVIDTALAEQFDHKSRHVPFSSPCVSRQTARSISTWSWRTQGVENLAIPANHVKSQNIIGTRTSSSKRQAGDADSQTREGENSINVSRGEDQNMQSVYDKLFVKLRGEIDPFTRIGIVIRAAMDARGALARAYGTGAVSRRVRGTTARHPVSGRALEIPNTIDYDHVESTLSLIELASRAAGPEAGKQMLQALSGLDRKHQKVMLEDSKSVGGDGAAVYSSRGKDASENGRLNPFASQLGDVFASHVSSDEARRQQDEKQQHFQEGSAGISSRVRGQMTRSEHARLPDHAQETSEDQRQGQAPTASSQDDVDKGYGSRIYSSGGVSDTATHQPVVGWTPKLSSKLVSSGLPLKGQCKRKVAEWGKAACSGGGTRYTDAQRNIVSEAFSANGARSSTSGATPDVSIPHSNGRQGCASALSETATVGCCPSRTDNKARRTEQSGQCSSSCMRNKETQNEQKHRALRCTRPRIVRCCPLIDALHPALAGRRSSQPQHRRASSAGVPFLPSGKTKTLEVARVTVVSHLANQLANDPVDDGPAEHVEAPLPALPSPALPTVCPSLILRSFSKTEKDDNTRGVLKQQHGRCLATRAGRLTELQWSAVEEWIERARRFLGPDVWDCLGTGTAFRHLRDCLRTSVLSGVGGNVSGKTLRDGSSRQGEISRHGCQNWCGERDGELVSAVAMPSVDPLAQGSSRSCGPVNVWYDHLSQKAALILEATLWMLAPEIQRLAVCATLRRESSENPGRGSSRIYEGSRQFGDSRDQRCMEFELRTGDGKGDVGVSLLRARRHVRARLVDGVNVLNADVDLAFRRWEDGCRIRKNAAASAGRKGAIADRSRPNGAVGGYPGYSSRASIPFPTVSHRIARSGSSGNSRINVHGYRGGLCEAVGCSEVARYGERRPSSAARYCRRHRADGMTDIAGVRCEWQNCRRLALSGDKSTSGRALCAMHLRESHVDLEGLSFVVLVLASARQSRSRVPSFSAAKGVHVASRCFAFQQATGERWCQAAFNASVVRSALLALTEQPLVPSPYVSPNVSGIQALDAVADSRGGVVRIDITDSKDRTARQQHGSLASSTLAAMDRGDTVNKSRPTDEVQTTPEQQRDVINEFAQNRDQSAQPEHFATLIRRMASSFESHLEPWEDQTSASLSRNGSTSPEAATADEAQTLMSRDSRGTPTTGGRKAQNGVDGFEVISRQCYEGAMRFALRGANTGDSSVQRGLGQDRFRGSNQEVPNVSNQSQEQNKASVEHMPRGVAEVLKQNTRQLRAIFEACSHSSCSRREMHLPDLLKFCDEYELRPCLVTTDEIIGAYKEVTLPRTKGFADGENWYYQPRSANAERVNVTPLERLKHFNHADVSLGPGKTSDDVSLLGVSDDVKMLSATDETCTVGASSCNTAGIDGRKVYLGREQKFPLRRVEMKPAAREKSFGMRDLASAPPGGNGKKPSMGGNGCTTRASSDSRSPISPKEKSLSTWETADSSLASGLSESQFLQWLSWLIVRSSTLNRISTKNFGPSMISSARSREVRSAENDKLNSVNSAGAMALLQWVELSRGARKNCIPSFQLSSSLL